MKDRKPFAIATGVPIVGFTGINGAGKTLLAVNQALCDMAGGRRVISTVPITHPQYGESEPLRSMGQLSQLRDATLLLDDVSVIFSSRTTSSLPADVITFLHTLRHRNMTVIWTAPEWMRADNNLRGVTQALVNVAPLLRVHDGSLWPRPRIAMAGVLDTTTGKADATPVRVLRRRFFAPSHLASFGAYDTQADTPMIGGHFVGGVCVDCGGSVTRPKHSQERHEQLGITFTEN